MSRSIRVRTAYAIGIEMIAMTITPTMSTVLFTVDLGWLS